MELEHERLEKPFNVTSVRLTRRDNDLWKTKASEFNNVTTKALHYICMVLWEVFAISIEASIPNIMLQTLSILGFPQNFLRISPKIKFSSISILCLLLSYNPLWLVSIDL